VFGNRVVRKIFIPKREDVTGAWRTLHNEELHNLVGKPGGKGPLGKPRRRGEDNISVDLTHRDLGWANFDWLHLAQDVV
jgi:hypothetical protein